MDTFVQCPCLLKTCHGGLLGSHSYYGQLAKRLREIFTWFLLAHSMLPKEIMVPFID